MNTLSAKCLQCASVFQTTEYIRSLGKGKYCSRKCADLAKIGIHPSSATRAKMSRSHTGKHPMSDELKERLRKLHTNKVVSPETREKIREARKYQVNTNRGMTWVLPEETRKKMSLARSGSNNARWIADRSLLKKTDRRGDPAYKEWRKNVWSRDSYKCRLYDLECNGRIEAHHIKIWSLHPELRYEVDNGITLCSNHHPRSRSKETEMAPMFQSLIKFPQCQVN